MKKNNITLLKLIEYSVYAFTFFIITYDFILPKNISNSIYEFGTAKLSILVLSVLIVGYILIGLKEREYLYQKFTKKHIISAFLVSIICLLLYFTFVV
ncbi:Hypothetical transmembrane protein [Flavobacterium indicum GPTSA100-9 = DSM 17447]|uniref:Hypothetical transmembrane protein n=1 Tax=Flavobacterium indicum (strain DSM 17447 / CIP 109464 / GPTSA100-9) TaxID=1094466 RepID=H8XSX0_FLAIG|nr:hypothetical protein [Flavobacterium indicum]CCG53512.1 Hypothetical transmembrane protein [Flavobacterium indicum GPTSA100-9 = DSM 17447]